MTHTPRIKVRKAWLEDGSIVLIVTDHNKPYERHDLYVSYHRDTIRVAEIFRMTLPRATPRAEVQNAIRTLKTIYTTITQ